MANQETSIADVVKNALHDAQDLIRGEIALAKAEAREEISRIGAGAALLAAAAFCGAVAVIFLLTAIAWGISEGLQWPVWSGFAIVTLVVLIAAAVLGVVGRNRLRAERHMPRTVDTMKENAKWMRARTS